MARENSKTEAEYKMTWTTKKGYLITEIEKVFIELKNVVNLGNLTYNKYYLGVNINGKNRVVIKFRPATDHFFLEICDKTRKGEMLHILRIIGVPIEYLNNPKDEPKRYYYRITLGNYTDYLGHRDAINTLVKYCYNIYGL